MDYLLAQGAQSVGYPHGGVHLFSSLIDKSLFADSVICLLYN